MRYHFFEILMITLLSSPKQHFYTILHTTLLEFISGFDRCAKRDALRTLFIHKSNALTVVPS